MNLRQAGLAAALVALLLFGISIAAQAQAQAQAQAPDTDGAGVPDSVDNGLDLPNGPNEYSNQVDTDEDGFGNRCDPDVNNDGLIAGKDVTIFLSEAGGIVELVDFNGDGVATGTDWAILAAFMNMPPGPSGLACADPLIDVDMGDAPCTP